MYWLQFKRYYIFYKKKVLIKGFLTDIKSYEFPTVNDKTLLKFPCFELDDKMACSNSAPTCKLHQGSNKSFYFTSSFSQNFGKELLYSQEPSYNKPSNQAEFSNHAGSAVSNPCEATVSWVENKCSKPSYENNPIDKLLFMQNNYFTSLWMQLYKRLAQKFAGMLTKPF